MTNYFSAEFLEIGRKNWTTETFEGHNKSLWAGNEFWFSTDDRNHVNSLSQFVCFAIYIVLFARK